MQNKKRVLLLIAMVSECQWNIFMLCASKSVCFPKKTRTSWENPQNYGWVYFCCQKLRDQSCFVFPSGKIAWSLWLRPGGGTQEEVYIGVYQRGLQTLTLFKTIGPVIIYRLWLGGGGGGEVLGVKPTFKCYFDDFRDPLSPCLHFPSKFEWSSFQSFQRSFRLGSQLRLIPPKILRSPPPLPSPPQARNNDWSLHPFLSLPCLRQETFFVTLIHFISAVVIVFYNSNHRIRFLRNTWTAYEDRVPPSFLKPTILHSFTLVPNVIFQEPRKL